MASSAVRGQSMTISIDGESLGESRDFSLTMDQGEIPIGSRDSSRWGEFLSGTRGWTITFDHLYITSDVAKKNILEHYDSTSATPPDLDIIITVSSQTFTGSGNLTSYTLNFPYEGAVEASGTIKGSSTLTISVS